MTLAHGWHSRGQPAYIGIELVKIISRNLIYTKKKKEAINRRGAMAGWWYPIPNGRKRISWWLFVNKTHTSNLDLLHRRYCFKFQLKTFGDSISPVKQFGHVCAWENFMLLLEFLLPFLDKRIIMHTYSSNQKSKSFPYQEKPAHFFFQNETVHCEKDQAITLSLLQNPLFPQTHPKTQWFPHSKVFKLQRFPLLILQKLFIFLFWGGWGTFFFFNLFLLHHLFISF